MRTRKKRRYVGGSKCKSCKKEHTYSEEDYKSGDGMLTNVWGPSMWHFLHTMSFNYPVNPTKEDKKHYRDFILNLQYTLPCKYCRINLVKNLKELPPSDKVMSSRENFSKYVYDLHNLINKMLKKNIDIPFCEIREKYENFRARCNTKKITTRKKKEKGCSVPLHGKKSRCIIKIVPQERKGNSFQMDKQCFKKKY